MTEITILSTIILTIVLAITLHDFYSMFFKSNAIHSKKILFVSFIVYFLSSIALNLISTPPELNIIITYIITLLIAMNYRVHLSSKIFSSLFITAIFLASEILTPHLFSVIFNTSAIMLLENEVAVLYLFAISRFIPFTIIKIIKFNIILKGVQFDKSNELQFVKWTMIVALPICSLILMYCLYELSKSLVGDANIVISISILVIIMFNLIFYAVYLNL